MCSQFVPNTLVAVFRDGTIPDGLDAWDNPVPPTSPSADEADVKDQPALLVEYGQSGRTGSSTRQPASGRSDVTHRYTLRLRPGAVSFEITPRDRVLDQRTGRYFAVDEVPEASNVVQAADLRYVLRRVT
jgi:hypothetical protein